MAAFSLQVVAAIRGLWLVLGPEIAEGLSHKVRWPTTEVCTGGKSTAFRLTLLPVV